MHGGNGPYGEVNDEDRAAVLIAFGQTGFNLPEDLAH